MYQRIVLPLDGSAMAARAIGPARVLAAACDAPLLAVSCLAPDEPAAERAEVVRQQLADRDAGDVELRLPVTPGPVAPALAEVLDEAPGSLVVMASVARAHAAAIVGSVAEELLGATGEPVLLVGPHVEVERFQLAGPLLVPVDGSVTSEAAVPLARAWVVAFGLHPWVVSVVDRPPGAAVTSAADGDAFESAYVNRIARRLEGQAGVQVDFEVLRGKRPAEAIATDARERGAAVICASTHGHTGARRVALGSVAIAIVHHAPCPVLLTRPLQLDP